MPEIKLTPEQSALVQGIDEPIVVRDAAGGFVGRLSPSRFSPEEVAEAVKAANEDPRRYSTAQVLSHLLLLSEAEERKGAALDSTEVNAILNNL